MIEKLNNAVIKANKEFAKMNNAPHLNVDSNSDIGGYDIFSKGDIIAHVPTLEAAIAIVDNAPMLYIWGYTDAIVDMNRPKGK